MILKEALLRRLLFLTIFFMPVWPGFVALKWGSLPGLDPTRILMFVSMSVWLLLVFTSLAVRLRLIKIVRENGKVFFWLYMLFGWKLLSAITADTGVSPFVSASRDIVYFLLVFLLALTVVKTESHINGVLRAIVLASIFIVLVANLEVVHGKNLFSDYATPGVEAEQLLIQQTRDGEIRVSGTFSNPLALASYISFSFPILGYVFYRSPRLFWRMLALLAMLLSTSAMYHTHSRGGLVVLTLFFILYFWRNISGWLNRIRREWRPVIMMVVASGTIFLAAVFLGVAMELAQGRSETESGSTEIRALQMAIGVPKVTMQPWVGYGPGKAAEVLGLLAKTVDNYYLTLALESGLPELIAFAGLLAGMIVIGWRTYRAKWRCRNLGGVLTMAILGNVLFMSVLSLEQVLPMMFVAFAMLLVLDTQLRQVQHNLPRLTHNTDEIQS